MKGLKAIRSKWPINFISLTELSYFKSENSEPYKTLKPPQTFLPVSKSLHLPPRRHKHAERAEDKEGETCIVATEEVGELHVCKPGMNLKVKKAMALLTRWNTTPGAMLRVRQ